MLPIEGKPMTRFFDDVPVTPRTLAEIDRIASSVREQFSVLPDDFLDIDELLRRMGIELSVKSDSEMQRAAALAAPKAKRIFVRRKVTQELRRGCVITRGILAHELGHVVLHGGAELKPLVVGGNERPTFIREDESAEEQAWKFGRSLLLPMAGQFWDRDDFEIGSLMGVPREAVATRRSEISQLRAAARPKADISNLVATALNALQPNLVARYSALELRQRRKIWDLLEICAGQDPDEYRLCKGYLIRWTDYKVPNPPSHLGWEIWNGEILPLMTAD